MIHGDSFNFILVFRNRLNGLQPGNKKPQAERMGVRIFRPIGEIFRIKKREQNINFCAKITAQNKNRGHRNSLA